MRKVLTGRLFAQKPEDKHKIYRLHAPEVDLVRPRTFYRPWREFSGFWSGRVR